MTQFKMTLENVTENDIPALIGKGGSSIKSVKNNAWRVYTSLQKSERKVDEPKPKLRIELRTAENSGSTDDSDDASGCVAIIHSQSETMIKIAKQCLEDYVKSYVHKKKKFPLSLCFALEFPHDLIGLLVSRLRGSKRGDGLIQSVISLSENVGEALPESAMESTDIATFRRSRFWIKAMNVSSVEELQKVLSRGIHFIGWAPGPNHDLKDLISIRVTFPRDCEPLKNREVLIERLEDVIKRFAEDIKAQKVRDNETMDAALDDDLEMEY